MKSKKNGSPVKFAMVGLGAISKKHVHAIKNTVGAQLVGASDLNCNVAKSFQEQYSVPSFVDCDKMISGTNPDVIVISTPSGCHAKNVLELVKYNKHFVVEKPLALRLSDADQILKECSSRGLRVFVVQQNRFNPPILKLRDALDENRFGKLVLGTIRLRWCREQKYYDQHPWRGSWSFDGGVLSNQANHHVDMLIWLMGEPESVMAMTATRLVNIEAEDTAIALIKFTNGALGLIEATTATRPKDLEGSISILGEKGSVEIAGFFMNKLKTWNFTEHHKMDEQVWEKYSTVPDEFAYSHRCFYENVANSLISHQKALLDGLDGRKSLELISAIYESVETGKTVDLKFNPKYCRLGQEISAV